MTNITMLVANRPQLTRQALDSIGDLSEATIAIRDAGMNEEVGSIVETWCALREHTVPFYSPEPLGTGPARNEVIKASEDSFGRGDYLYLSDDDVCFLRPDWLAALIRAYEKAWGQGFGALGAYNHPFNQPVSWWGDVYEVYALATQSMLMRWEVWDEFGPFCQTPAGKVCQSEDVDFSNRVRAKGYKVGVIAPPLLVNCGITNSFGEKIVGWELVKAQAPEGVLVV